MSALLVAVIVNDPALEEEKAAVVGVGLVSVPPVVLQVAPALPTSLVTVAAKDSV